MWPSKPPLRKLANQSFSRTPSARLAADWSANRSYKVLPMEPILDLASGHAVA
jgi:hypothetical protein